MLIEGRQPLPRFGLVSANLDVIDSRGSGPLLHRHTDGVAEGIARRPLAGREAAQARVGVTIT
jgi:hypothetical protein